MDGNWYTKFATTLLFAGLAGAYLVWTVGGWSTEDEIKTFEDRTSLLEAAVDSAADDVARASAQATLDDHIAKAPPAADGTGGGSHADAHKRAPSWARCHRQRRQLVRASVSPSSSRRPLARECPPRILGGGHHSRRGRRGSGGGGFGHDERILKSS